MAQHHSLTTMQALLESNVAWWQSGGHTTDKLHIETIDMIEAYNYHWDMNVLGSINARVITIDGQAADTHKARCSVVKALVTNTDAEPCECPVHARFTRHGPLNKIKDHVTCDVTQHEYLTFALMPDLMDKTMKYLSSQDKLATAWIKSNGCTGTERYMEEYYEKGKSIPLSVFKFKKQKKTFVTTSHLFSDNAERAWKLAHKHNIDLDEFAVMTVIDCSLPIVLEALEHCASK